MRSEQWDVFHRCLTLLSILQRNPAQRDELIQQLYRHLPPQAAISRLEKDLARLRHKFSVDIHYEPSEREYSLCDIGNLPLLDLPDNALQAIGFLAKSFDSHTPQFANVQALILTINRLLSPERRRQLQKQAELSVDLRPLDQDEISVEVWQKLETVFRERRLIEFEYRSPRHTDEEIPRQHVVEIRDLRFDVSKGHYYAHGYCRHVIGPHGRFDARRYFYYRIGRIIPTTIALLPDRFPLIAPHILTFRVEYKLTAQIARLGVSHHFKDTTTETLPDGSVVVCAVTDDVFSAARNLLHYGSNCQVLGGEEMLAEMRKITQQMAQLYENDPNSSDSSTDMEEH